MPCGCGCGTEALWSRRPKVAHAPHARAMRDPTARLLAMRFLLAGGPPDTCGRPDGAREKQYAFRAPGLRPRRMLKGGSTAEQTHGSGGGGTPPRAHAWLAHKTHDTRISDAMITSAPRYAEQEAANEDEYRLDHHGHTSPVVVLGAELQVEHEDPYGSTQTAEHEHEGRGNPHACFAREAGVKVLRHSIPVDDVQAYEPDRGENAWRPLGAALEPRRC